MHWWRDAVFYEVYVPSFTDSDGDGIGDLEGVRSRLGYLELLGVDALWLSPIYPSPMVDHGYDVTDHRAVDPIWGDLDALDALVADAHAHGIRVTVDLVPNHTSDQHAWFRAALGSPPDSPQRARYHFHPGREGGTRPPNDWLSVFGGPAWTREPHAPADQGPDEEPDERTDGAAAGRGTWPCCAPPRPPGTGRTSRCGRTWSRRCGSGWSAGSTGSASTPRTA